MATSQRLLLLVVVVVVISGMGCPSHQQQHKMNPIDLAALSAIKDTLTDIPGTTFFSTWDFTSPDPCSTFSGITCSSFNPSVTSLALGDPLSNSPSLAGFLSPCLSNLTSLTQLILYPGLVTGPIPPQLGQLRNLRVISFANNRLTGSIPTSLSLLPYLHTLDLSSNRLSGSIPPALFQSSTDLKVVILASNSLSGDLPTTISTPLLHLDLKSNRLTGGLPLKMPSSLRYLSVSKNQMWGQLNGLDSLLELAYLDLSMNYFNGTIPLSLFRPSLSSLLLQRNNLTGGVPSIYGPPPSYGSGSVVDLSHNFLTGELPPVLAGVETLFLNNNHLIGKVPKEYVDSLNRGTTITLYLQHNFITEFPLEQTPILPQTVSLCLSYNCFLPVPPLGLTACPASAGGQVSRPGSQCAAFNNGSSVH